ncbi:tRNA lysidine(34) synthetase TilS [Thioclava sp. F42-5]|uniref:tRNA lysidine(34) synthetase TilS n=1 Tax=Thioclava sp. F42-5 TaxID=1973005 RepID=UPI0023E3628A|nr:tRNA lysidine(34) synthetase TilS [Thioclava sp. F42-5]
MTLDDIARHGFDPDAPRRVGVAVSGGSDSMATLALLAAHFEVAAVTVDHGLRAEAAEEAAFVGRFCADRGISHTILRWDGASAEGNLMDAARRARLGLIGAWAGSTGISHVALGHTADDQAETFLMRLAREAGLEGLSGMRPRFEAEGVTWHRPFLTQTREALRDYLRRQGIAWVDDPSNENERFDRVKARQALGTLKSLGVDAQAIAGVTTNLASANAALHRLLMAEVERHVSEQSGDLLIDATGFSVMDPELQRRLIVAALRWISGADYAPRAAKVQTLLAELPRQGDRTLHGCRITTAKGALRITREAQAVADLRVTLEDGAATWDRWEVTGPAMDATEVAALGEAGLRQCPDWRETGLPRASLAASPAIWRGETLVAAPLAGFGIGWQARICRDAFDTWLIRR